MSFSPLDTTEDLRYNQAMKRVLFVCLGNICRSPAGEAILRHFMEIENRSHEVEVDSCGIGPWHVGEKAHPQMRKAAETRGYRLTGVAKQFQNKYFDDFDYILAAEKSVLDHLRSLTTNPKHLAKVHLVTDFSERHKGSDVPDPYYGGDEHFEETLDILEHLCQEFKRQHLDEL